MRVTAFRGGRVASCWKRLRCSRIAFATLTAIATGTAGGAVQGAVPGARPQTPQPPFPYATSDVTVRNEATGVSLSCTLLIPHATGPSPAVVFLSGSGPQDRDETLAGHKPFLVIADRLARKGVASLRCDDRGVGGSEGSVAQATIADSAADAAAALQLLRKRSSIDAQHLGLIGHSEGGLVAAKVAAGVPEVDFVVLLAAPGVPLNQLFLQQQHDLLKARGIAEPLLARVDREIAAEVSLARDESLSTRDLKQRLQARAARLGDIFTKGELADLRMTPERIRQGIRLTTTPWFRSLVRERPREYLERLEIPVLALFGSKDLQVAPYVNAAAMTHALAAAPTDCYSVRVLPDLNHLFQHARTGRIDEYARLRQTFAEEALGAIASWIAQATRVGRPCPASTRPADRSASVRQSSCREKSGSTSGLISAPRIAPPAANGLTSIYWTRRG